MDGSFRYAIPIAVPPGRLGMAPSLALAYSSRNPANGALGVGWSIEGTSQISRCDRVVASGGVRSTIKFVPDDAYCLDNQRLILVDGTAGTTTAEYRTEVDTFARIKVTAANDTGPVTWKVERKNGQTATYDTLPASVEGGSQPWTKRYAFQANGTADGAPVEVTLHWPLTKVVDRANNGIVYSYVRSSGSNFDNGADEPLISQIDYTTCENPEGTACEFASSTNPRRVKFDYEARDGDSATRYVSGVPLRLARRLKTITTSIQAGDGTWTSQGSLTFDYLATSSSRFTKRTLLRAITVCDGAAACAAPTRFEWTSESTGYSARAASDASFSYSGFLVNSPKMEVFAYDVDGDGNDDLLFHEPSAAAQGNGQPAAGTTYREKVAYADGDGHFRAIEDVEFPDSACRGFDHLGMATAIDLDRNGVDELIFECDGKYRVHGFAGSTGRFTALTVSGISGKAMPGAPTIPGRTVVGLEGALKFGDLNGDGFFDLLFGDTFSDARWTVRLGSYRNRDGDAPDVQYATARNLGLRSIGAADADPRGRGELVAQATTVLDLDRDGHDELTQLDFGEAARSVAIDGESTVFGYRNAVLNEQFRQATNANPPAEPTWGSATFLSVTSVGLWYFIDLNGDGYKDALYREETGSPWQPDVTWKIRFNTGIGFGSVQQTIQGDAAAALAAIPSDLWKMIPGGGSPQPFAKGQDNGVRIADMNGDGFEDLVLLGTAESDTSAHWSGLRRTSKGIRVMYSDGSSLQAPVEISTLGFERLSRGEERNPRWPMTVLADVDGNGLPDVVDMIGVDGKKRQLATLALDRPGGVDLLRTVSDERGEAIRVVYDSMSKGSAARLALAAGSADTHQPGRGAYPAPATAKGAVVREIHQRTTRDLDQVWLYQVGLTDVTGRGFLGFEQVKMIDRATNVPTTYEFDRRVVTVGPNGAYRHYTMLGKPSWTQTWKLTEGDTAVNVGPAQDLVAATGNVLAPAVGYSEDWSGHPLHRTGTHKVENAYTFRPASSALDIVGPSRFTNTTYDDFGNPTVVDEIWQDVSEATRKEYQRTRTTTFANTTKSWRIGEAQKTVDTTTATDAYLYNAGYTTPTTRTATTETTFDDKGMPIWIVREPNKSAGAPAGTNGDLRMTEFVRGSSGVINAIKEYAPTGRTCSTSGNCQSGELCATATKGAVKQCWSHRDEAFTYDASGTVAEGFTNALGQTSWTLYDPARMWVYAKVDPNGVKTSITRDGFGRVREVTSDTGAKITYEHAWNMVREIVKNGARSTTFFDGHERPELTTWSTFGGGSGVTQRRYDSLGNLVNTTYKESASSEARVSASVDDAQRAARDGVILQAAQYDTAGRPTTQQTGVDDNTAIDYSGPIGEIHLTDAEGNEQRLTNNIVGQMTKLVQYSGNGSKTTRYGYLASGELAAIDANGGTDRFFFDKIGRPVRWEVGGVSPENPVVRWADPVYDSYDRVLSVKRDGLLVTSTFDLRDRVLTRTSEGEVQTFAWDPAGAIGQLQRATNDNGDGIDHEIVYSNFDSLGRARERRENFAGGATSLSFGFTFDSVGRLDTLRYPEAAGSNDVFASSHTALAGPTVKYNYQNGQIKSITEVADGNPVLWQATARHVLGMVTAATYGAGNQAVTATWGYDPNTAQVTQHAVAGTTGGTAPQQTFGYYTNRNLRERTTGSTRETYTYDGAPGFLEDYHRDAGASKIIDATYRVGRQGLLDIRTSASTGSPDWPLATEDYSFRSTPGVASLAQVAQIETQTIGSTVRTFNYDSAGRVTDVLEGDAVKRHFVWNSFNLPKTIEYHGPDVTRSFVYTAYGDRARKRQNSSNEVYYVGKLYEARKLASGSESVYRLATDTGVVGELAHAWGGSSREVRHLFTDQQGSPAYQVVNRAATTLGFFPYGKRQGTAPTQKFSQLGYTGHVQDDDLDLIDMKGRVFDISSKRFLTRDVVPDRPFATFGTNAYAYVTNNPTNLTDPTGFSASGYPGACAQCVSLNPLDKVGIVGIAEVVIEVHTEQCGGRSEVIDGDGLNVERVGGPGDPGLFAISTGELLHLGLGFGGMIPLVGAAFDAVDAGMYALEGDFTSAGIAAAAILPGVGDLAGGAKLAKKVHDYADRLKNIRKVLKGPYSRGNDIVSGARAVTRDGRVFDAVGRNVNSKNAGAAFGHAEQRAMQAVDRKLEKAGVAADDVVEREVFDGAALVRNGNEIPFCPHCAEVVKQWLAK